MANNKWNLIDGEWEWGNGKSSFVMAKERFVIGS